MHACLINLNVCKNIVFNVVAKYLYKKIKEVMCMLWYTKLTFPAFDTSILSPSDDDHCKSNWSISFEPILAAEISGKNPFCDSVSIATLNSQKN